jgi:hypothetical protein
MCIFAAQMAKRKSFQWLKESFQWLKERVCCAASTSYHVFSG